MNYGNTQFLKGLGWIIGVNVLINILPSPWGLISFMALAGWAIYELWYSTRY